MYDLASPISILFKRSNVDIDFPCRHWVFNTGNPCCPIPFLFIVVVYQMLKRTRGRYSTFAESRSSLFASYAQLHTSAQRNVRDALPVINNQYPPRPDLIILQTIRNVYRLWTSSHNDLCRNSIKLTWLLHYCSYEIFEGCSALNSKWAVDVAPRIRSLLRYSAWFTYLAAYTLETC